MCYLCNQCKYFIQNFCKGNRHKAYPKGYPYCDCEYCLPVELKNDLLTRFGFILHLIRYSGTSYKDGCGQSTLWIEDTNFEYAVTPEMLSWFGITI